MAQTPVSCPLCEAHLRHQLRPHPMYSLAGLHLFRKWRMLDFQRGQILSQLDEKAGVESGIPLARIAEPAPSVVAEQQSPKANPASFGIGEAANNKFLLLPAFKLQP